MYAIVDIFTRNEIADRADEDWYCISRSKKERNRALMERSLGIQAKQDGQRAKIK